MRSHVIVAFVILALPGLVRAQDTAVGKVAVDLAVPESPAFTVLGLNPQTVTRPSSPLQFATSLLNGVDKNGNFQSGVAIDTQPYMLWRGRSVTWTRYGDHWPTRFVSRAQFSLATAKGASDEDKSVRIAMGGRFTVFDLGDPFRDQTVADCLTAAHKTALGQGPVPGPKATSQEIEAHPGGAAQGTRAARRGLPHRGPIKPNARAPASGTTRA